MQPKGWIVLATCLLLTMEWAQAAAEVSTTFNGSGTYTVPTGITLLKVELWGGGGGGSSTPGKGGAGGGAGAYAIGYVTVTPGNTYSFTVGTGGAAGGSAGNATYFINSSTLNAGGGGGGGANAGGNGGSASGSALTSGTTGCSGGASAGSAAGGGGGAGSPPSCTNGAPASGDTGGAGGTGEGVGGNGGNMNVAGTAGSAPGAGGGGNGQSKAGGAGANGRVVITYNFPLIALADASVTEGDSGTSMLSIPVTITNPKAAAIVANYSFADGTATGGASCTTGVDYINTAGAVTIPANTSSYSIPVTICNETQFEPDETFAVSLDSVTNAYITNATAAGTILDDDPATVITLGNASVTEGNSGTTTLSIPVLLSAPSNDPLVLSYGLTNGTAVGGAACATGIDYINTVADITIPTGQITGSIPVAVCGDTMPEPDETLSAQLTNIVSGSGALGSPAVATGTITTDDGSGVFTITVPHLVAGTAGTGKIASNAQGFKNTTHYVLFAASLLDPAAGSGVTTFNGAALPATLPLSFDANSEASFSIAFDNVGQVQLSANWQPSYDSPAPTDTPPTASGSGSYIVAPASLAVTPSGPYVAGTVFSVAVVAKNSSGAIATNFGRESSVENVALGHTLVGPAGGIDPALTGTTTVSDAAFQTGNGSVTVSDLVWAEVGDIALTASLASGSYLGSGLTASGSDSAGPFKPAYFETAVTPGTGSFTYAGQPFGVTVTARSAIATTTQNYKGSYARPTTLTDANSAANSSGTLGTLTNATIVAASFSDGVASATTPTYILANKTTAPLETPSSVPLKLRATDTDGVTSSGHAEGTTPVRSGRLHLFNFYGSELLRPRIEYRAEYWNGSRWTTNALDSTTSIAAGNLVTGGLVVNNVGSLVAGVGFMTFNTPGVAGSYDIAFNLGAGAADSSCNASHPASTGANLPWLQGYWSGSCGATPAWQQDPSARVRLGAAKAPYLYLRERY